MFRTKTQLDTRDGAVHQGLLNYRRLGESNWRVGWFVLRERSLELCAKERGEVILEIPLVDSTVNNLSRDLTGGYNNCFEVWSDESSMHFFAKSYAEMNTWFKELSRLITVLTENAVVERAESLIRHTQAASSEAYLAAARASGDGKAVVVTASTL